jgi:hypothetical protein
LFGAAWLLFLRRGSSRSDSFCHVCCLSRSLFFKIAYPADCALLGIDEKWAAEAPDLGRSNTGSAFRHLRARHAFSCTPIGSQRRTNSSARATAAATTARELTSKVRLRDRGTVLRWK